MKQTEVAHGFRRREPWVTRFVIDDVKYGGEFDPVNDGRVAQFLTHFPRARVILELGSLEGGHSFALARHPQIDRVVAVEGREANVEKASFVKELMAVRNVEFVTANLEDVELSKLGKFDAVFCVGLLYHLPRPWKLLDQVADVSANLFIWTHYAAKEETELENGVKGRWYRELGVRDPLSGLSVQSFWPTLESLKDMLMQNGFGSVRIIDDHPGHPHGPCVTLAAVAES